MTLIKYKQKRKFTETPEPEGKEKSSAGALTFVIQKHQASHLHYDFRLEMEGVLKSWAVPKGPSLNPKDKRLAMMVEDHPFDYRNFEGRIPEGNYGAGDVIVWDNGTYFAVGSTNRQNSEMLMLKSLEAGHMDFFMEGKKLRGEFSLIKFRRGGENSWLLVKKNDQYANEADNILEEQKSVISGKKVKEKTKKPIPHEALKAVIPSVGSPKMKVIKPMLATLIDKPFDREDWLFEIKWDGYRAIAEVGSDQSINLYSRTGKTYNEKYPEIVKALSQINHETILDGEIVVVDEKGNSNFQMLQNYGNTKEGSLVYYVFDLLSLDNQDVTSLPLRDRKELLSKLLKGGPSRIKYSDHVEEKGIQLFEQVKKQGIEGIVAKEGTSLYRPGVRADEWLKIKTHKRQEVIICGFTQPKGSRKYFGSLVLGLYHNSQLEYVGNSGSGFNIQSLKVLYEKLKPLIMSRSPFNYKVTALAPITWVEPKLICEVEFAEWTKHVQMRHPIFQGLREDKKPQEVKREKEINTSEVVNSDLKLKNSTKHTIGNGLNMNNTNLQITHLDKVYWPKEGYTKCDLLAYYNQMSGVILPYLKDRPESLNRHPNGITKTGFFQKNIAGELPSFVETVAVKSESGNKDIHYLVCQNKDTLLYMANLGCIEINPWNSRIGALDKPDYMVLDLDPGEISFHEVVIVALEIKKLLDKIGVTSYCKTSGKTGLHIFIPTGAKYDYEQIKQFSQLIAILIHKKLPDTTSVVRDPKKRLTCIYLDFLQNRFGQTLAAPYSVRPYTGATVSTPLEWKEVNKNLDPGKFTIKTVLSRLQKKGDLWAPVLKQGFNLKRALKNLES